MTVTAPFSLAIAESCAPRTGGAARVVRRPYLLTTSAYQPAAPTAWPPHAHDEHELLWSERGVVTTKACGREWTVTPGVGVWVPAGVVHEASTHRGTHVRTTYFSKDGWPKAWDGPVVVTVNAATRELLMHLRSVEMSTEQRIRAQRVCIDMLQLVETVPFEVPIPGDPRIARLVDSVLANPSDDRSLDQWAAVLNMTSRTLTRVFAADVAMSFARWRRLVRMAAAAGDLADGASVKVVARKVGYRSTSAFVAAFHKTVGYPPGGLAEHL